MKESVYFTVFLLIRIYPHEFEHTSPSPLESTSRNISINTFDSFNKSNIRGANNETKKPQGLQSEKKDLTFKQVKHLFSVFVLQPTMNNPNHDMILKNKYTLRSKAVIYRGEMEYVSRCVLDYPDIETGGDLFGFWTYSGFPVIQYVIGPGKRANHEFAFFNQDLEYLKKVGNALRRSHGLQHIGEWHSHHKLGLAEPSEHDISTVTNAIDTYNLGKFFLVIANVHESSSIVNGFMFKKDQGRVFDYTGWILLDGESPIRRSFDEEHCSVVYVPRTQRSSIVNLETASFEEIEYLKPEYTSEYWLSNKTNHKILQKIVEALNKCVQDVKVFQDDNDRSVYLQFKYQEHPYLLSFPRDFPKVSPIIMQQNKKNPKDLNEVKTKWEPEEDISLSVVSFVKNGLRISSGTFIQKLLSR